MSFPAEMLDQWMRWFPMNADELAKEAIKPHLIERLQRIRGMYAHWLQFPTKMDGDLVRFDQEQFGVGRSQSYEDLRLVKLLLGDMQQASKDFMRWKINKDLEHDLQLARRAGDFRAVASIEKNRILNNRTDKPDEPELEFDKIMPQLFEPTDDPSVLGIKRIPDLRSRIAKLKKRYESAEELAPADFEEITDEDEEEMPYE